MSYLLIKWLHVLSATVLVGTGFGSAFYKWMSDRSADIGTIARIAHFVVIADWVFTTPAVVLQPLTGILLVRRSGYPLSHGWLACALLLYLVAGLCWIPVVFLQYRMRRLARAALAAGSALTPEYARCARAWFWLGVPAFASMIAIYGLMVIKP